MFLPSYTLTCNQLYIGELVCNCLRKTRRQMREFVRNHINKRRRAFVITWEVVDSSQAGEDHGFLDSQELGRRQGLKLSPKHLGRATRTKARSKTFILYKKNIYLVKISHYNNHHIKIALKLYVYLEKYETFFFRMTIY